MSKPKSKDESYRKGYEDAFNLVNQYSTKLKQFLIQRARLEGAPKSVVKKEKVHSSGIKLESMKLKEKHGKSVSDSKSPRNRASMYAVSEKRKASFDEECKEEHSHKRNKSR